MSVHVRSLVRSILLMFVFSWSAVQPVTALDGVEPLTDTSATIMASQDGKLQMSPIRLPLEVLGWKQSGTVQRISRETIFDYMDGAGELYIGYRFRELEVREYESEKNGPILVELYFMESPDDAFGLLSLDWGGELLDEAIGMSWSAFQVGQRVATTSDSRTSERVGQEPASQLETGPTVGRLPSALFGSGLLRMRTGPIYVRMLAEQDTAATKQAITELAKIVASGGGKLSAPPPAIMAALPDAVGDYAPASSGKAFFRSHLVLNSVYFLATRNILDLGPACEAASSEYRRPGGGEQRKPRLLVVKYPTGEAALKGGTSFEQVYLSKPKRASEGFEWFEGQGRTVEIEEGWVGIARSGAFLAVAFDCPDDETARKFLNQSGSLITKVENAKLEGK